MPVLTTYYEVFCSCGKGLCKDLRAAEEDGIMKIIIEPCPDCLEKAKGIDYMRELQAIYDSEINFQINCFWDGGWEVAIGDEMNGWKIKHSEETLEGAIKWLIKAVCGWYPNSGYAKRKEDAQK